MMSISIDIDEESKIAGVFFSLKKAKEFCKTEYGIRIRDWSYDEDEKCYFYNPLIDHKLKTYYHNFVITANDVL